MEVNRFRVASLDSWKTCAPVPFCRLPHLITILIVAGSGKSILWFAEHSPFLSKITESSFRSSAIIEDIETMCDAGQAAMAYFYFDFRDVNKQRWRDLVSSLLVQLSTQSRPRLDILSYLQSKYYMGTRQPNDDALMRCLKRMLMLPDRRPIYVILDALDECSNVSRILTPRKQVLHLVKELVDLHIPNLHICVTSRLEVDIRDVLEPLTTRRVSLHEQSGQKKDIGDYVRSVVYSNSESVMRRWRKEDKELVVNTLSERADGMWVN